MSIVLYEGNVGHGYSSGIHPNLKLKVVDLNVQRHNGTCQRERERGSTYPVILTRLQMRTHRYFLSVTATATHHAHTGGSASCWLFQDDRQVTAHTVRQLHELIFKRWLCWKNTVSNSYTSYIYGSSSYFFESALFVICVSLKTRCMYWSICFGGGRAENVFC